MDVLRPILGAAAAALLVPQAAQAATLEPLAPCYRSVDAQTRETVPVNASGFTPGDEVTIRIDGAIAAEHVPVLTDGNVQSQVIGARPKDDIVMGLGLNA